MAKKKLKPLKIKKPKPKAGASGLKPKSLIDPKSTAVEKELKELKSRCQFLMAEYANYKKQNLKHLENLKKYEGEIFIKNFINKIMDDFERAVISAKTEGSPETFKAGVLMIYENLKKLLKEHNIKEKPCKGLAFDPSWQSALSSAVDKDTPADHIISVIKPAYFFHDKLLRPAEVIVSQTQAEDEKDKTNGS